MRFLLLVLFVSFYFPDSQCLDLHRVKRGDLLSQLGQAIQQITGSLGLNNNQKQPVNDPSFSTGPGSGTQVHPQQQSGNKPSFGHAVGYCQQSPRACDYLGCLGDNFKNGPQGQNMKQGSKVLADPDLRNAVKNDPAVLKQACEHANLNDNGCSNFRMILDLAEKLDPKSGHTHDESRDKRSPYDDYGNHAGSPPKSPSSSSVNVNANANVGASKTASSGSSSSASSGSNSKPAQGNSNSKPAQGGSNSNSHGGHSDYDYEHPHSAGGSSSNHGASQGTASGGSSGPAPYQEKDCMAILRGFDPNYNQNGNNNNNQNFNNNNNNNNNNQHFNNDNKNSNNNSGQRSRTKSRLAG